MESAIERLINKYREHLETKAQLPTDTACTYIKALVDKESGFFHFMALINVKALEDVKKEDIQSYRVWLFDQGFGKGYIEDRITAVNSFLDYLVRIEVLDGSRTENH